MMPPGKQRSVSGLAALFLATTAVFVQAACSKPTEASAQTTNAASIAQSSNAVGRRIAITATTEGYTPSTIDVKKGEAVVLVFTRTTKSDCLAEVVIPDLKIKKDLPLNTPVEIPVKLDKEGKTGFQCGMAMVKGTINVGN